VSWCHRRRLDDDDDGDDDGGDEVAALNHNSNIFEAVYWHLQDIHNKMFYYVICFHLIHWIY